jgi:hypothetical protein
MRRHLRSYLAVAALALAATLASVAIQRVGPTRLVEGEGFCPGMDPCRIPVLGGGFPFPWLVDNPQISVPDQLSPFEDHFYPGNFLVDLALWLVAIEIALGLWRRSRS